MTTKVKTKNKSDGSEPFNATYKEGSALNKTDFLPFTNIPLGGNSRTSSGVEVSTFRPLDNRVLIEQDTAETMRGGIILPDTAQEKPLKGAVVAIGPGSIHAMGLIPMSVKPGDKVLFGRYGYETVRLDNKDYLLMRESDIFAIL